MIVDREQLLKELESVTPGLSSREIIEQSSCFAFQNGVVATYNEEISCFQSTCLKIQGSVQAMKLLALLRKMMDKTVDITAGKAELRIKGKGRRRAGILMESKITLPIDSIKQPRKWIPLSDDFTEAVAMVESCVGKDQTQFHLTCVHLCPDWIEACDNVQVARFVTKTNLRSKILVRREQLKHVVSLGMTEFGKTREWLHFRNPNGLHLSCRLYIQEYPDIAPILKVTGTKTQLPKGIEKAVERASIFSETNVNDNQVVVSISKGKVNIKGTGTSGWYSETKRINYDGAPMCFTIPPFLLNEIVAKYDECIINKNRLKINVGKFSYVTVLGVLEDSVEGTPEKKKNRTKVRSGKKQVD
jgi:hypothetical protein